MLLYTFWKGNHEGWHSGADIQTHGTTCNTGMWYFLHVLMNSNTMYSCKVVNKMTFGSMFKRYMYLQQ